jgi:hypothetical protein
MERSKEKKTNGPRSFLDTVLKTLMQKFRAIISVITSGKTNAEKSMHYRGKAFTTQTLE